MPLFEVAVLETPTDNDKDAGQLEKIVLKPTFIIAKDSQSAAMKTVMNIDTLAAGVSFDKERLDIRVRPF